MASDEAHEFTHTVPVVVGGSECVIGHAPARREDHKVSNGSARLRRWAGQYCKDGRILQDREIALKW